jgi:peptidoglycan/LPS O-acetylase OafA/YrhL
MLKQVIKNVDKGARMPGLLVAELGLCITYLWLGVWQLRMAWDKPIHVGWVESAFFKIFGSIFCGWLSWKRRDGSRPGAFNFIILLGGGGSFVQDVLQWRASKEGAQFPTLTLFLIVFLIALIVWEWRIAKASNKADGNATDYEDAKFEEEDKP